MSELAIPRLPKHKWIESLSRVTPACVKPSDLSGTNFVQAFEMSSLPLGGRIYHVVLDVHVYIRVMVSCMCSMIRGLDIHDPASAASLYLVTHRIQSKVKR